MSEQLEKFDHKSCGKSCPRLQKINKQEKKMLDKLKKNMAELYTLIF